MAIKGRRGVLLFRMNIKRFSVIFRCFLATSVCVLADNVKISGKVIDSEDKPVEFATVKIAGTAIGTNTDLKACIYSLSVAATDTLKSGLQLHRIQDSNASAHKASGRPYPQCAPLSGRCYAPGCGGGWFRKNINGMQNLDTESFKLSPDVSGGSVEAMITTMAGVNSSDEMGSR